MTQLPVTPGEVIQCADFLNRVSLVRWRKTTAKQVVNTVTATDLLNGEITIDAGCMMIDRRLVLEAEGDLVNNSGSTQAAPQFQLRAGAIGGVTLLDTSAIASVWTTSATRFAWKIKATIQNLGATGSQWCTLDVEFIAGAAANGAAAFAAGEGSYLASLVSGGAGFYKALGGGSASVDTTVAFPLALRVILPAASASLDVTLKGAIVELV